MKNQHDPMAFHDYVEKQSPMIYLSMGLKLVLYIAGLIVSGVAAIWFHWYALIPAGVLTIWFLVSRANFNKKLGRYLDEFQRSASILLLFWMFTNASFAQTCVNIAGECDTVLQLTDQVNIPEVTAVSTWSGKGDTRITIHLVLSGSTYYVYEKRINSEGNWFKVKNIILKSDYIEFTGSPVIWSFQSATCKWVEDGQQLTKWDLIKQEISYQTDRYRRFSKIGEKEQYSFAHYLFFLYQ